MLKRMFIEGDVELYGDTNDYMISEYIDILCARRFTITEDTYSTLLPLFVHNCNQLIDQNIQNVIKYTHFYIDDKCFSIISENYKNYTLHDMLMNNEIEMSFDSKCKILLDVLKIIENVHSRNITIYELRSSNIIIHSDKVFLRNYGLAHFLQVRNKNFKLSALPYLAPEVIRNEKIDKTSDIFSIGILMWEIFSHSKIYPDFTHSKDLKIHILNLGRPDLSILTDTPEEIIDLMKVCWSNRPSDRPSIGEIRKALSELTNYNDS